jgi:hypothetical protein
VHGVVHLTARFAGHATERKILERCAEAASGMSLDVRKVDHERGVLNQPRHFPTLDAFVRTLVLVEIFFIGTRGGINRTANHFRGVPARLRAGRVPIDVHYKGLAATLFHRLHHAPHEDGMDGGIDHMIARVHFDDDSLFIDAVANVKLVEDQIELGGERLFRFQARLMGGTEKYFAGHNEGILCGRLMCLLYRFR